MPPDFAEMINVAKANGYYNYIDPFWVEIERLRNALIKIAAVDDMLANDRLATNGSYSGFDEPGSVQIARETLCM